jgi:hypothetical protein
MQKLKNKTLAILIAVILTSTSASMTLLPAANAHTPAWTIPTWAFLSVAPNPVSTGQVVSVNFWINQVPPTAFNVYGDRWHNMLVKVTLPDGTNKNLGPFTSDSTGGTHTTYTPTEIGNYTFVFSFPGQVLAGENPVINGPPFGVDYINDTFEASQSPSVTLVVQQQPIAPLPLTPLPTSYWTRPIPALNINWNTISGNWLGLAPVSFGTTGMYNADENFNPYTTAPNSAHIMWTKPYSFGGMIGGEFGGSETYSNYMSTAQYQPKFQPIVMNGVLYYTLFPGSSSCPEGWVAVDLRTGQTLWTKNTTTTLMCGQIYDFVQPSQYGGIPYLWDVISNGDGVPPPANNTYGMYDAMTGNWILNVTIPPTIGYGLEIPAVTWVEGKDGSLLGYYIDQASGTLNMWNSSKAIIQYGVITGADSDTFTWQPPLGATIPWELGIEWNVSIANTVSGNPIDPPLGISAVTSSVILLSSTPGGTIGGWQPGYVYRAGYSAVDGSLLWGPLNQTETPWTRLSTSPAKDGVFAEQINELVNQWTGYSINTGQKLWGPTVNPNPQDVFGYYTISSMIAYGSLFTADLGGYVHAYDIQTGKLLWTFFTGSSGLESPYGAWPIFHMDAIADGKIYIMGGHVYNPPLFRGSQLYCIDATSGKEIWSIFNFPTTNSASAAIADGILVEPNAYDNQIYAYGMGPSKTTISAPSIGVTTAAPMTITGTVTDISAGSQQNAVAANFPNGLPAVSDASMTQFMEAVYMQQTMPTNVTGVPVALSVIDSNGKNYNIGTTITNAMGTYGLTWTPTTAGNYTVVASFGGSQSYYGSSASTYFYASAASTTTTANSAADTYFVPAIAGLFVLVIIVLILVVLSMRKRP